MLLCLAGRGVAHQADTSYTKIRLTAESVQVTCTFDLLTLAKLAPLNANGDQNISRADLERAAPEIIRFIREHAILSLDGVQCDLGAAQASHWLEERDLIPISEWQTSLAKFSFLAPRDHLPRELSFVVDFFDALGERHTNLLSFEQPGRSDEQIPLSKLEPGFACEIAAPPRLWSRLSQFVLLGIKHIFFGYDHLLFLVGLIAATRTRDLLKIITAFTVAHTLTLALSAFKLVHVPSRWVELAISVTIMYVALENIWLRTIGRRWVLAFLFGLVHGFGFANVLRDLSPSTRGFIQSLLAFNVGVEIGQLAVVAILLPVTWWLARRSFAPQGRLALSAGIYLFGAAWFIDRAFGLRFMPF